MCIKGEDSVNGFNAFLKIIIVIALVISISACTTPKQSKEDYSTSTNKGTTEYGEYSAQWPTKEPIGDEMKEKILSMVNNQEDADKLIKTTYPGDVLHKLTVDITELFAETPPECIRLSPSGDNVYFVYKSDDGHYAFWMYSLKEDAGKVMQKWYCGKLIYSEDFDKMKEKRAIIKDVQKFDPYGSYTVLYSGVAKSLYSIHYTVDGYRIKLDYGKTNGKGDIIKITKFSGKDNPLYYNLLPIDKALLIK